MSDRFYCVKLMCTNVAVLACIRRQAAFFRGCIQYYECQDCEQGNKHVLENPRLVIEAATPRTIVSYPLPFKPTKDILSQPGTFKTYYHKEPAMKGA